MDKEFFIRNIYGEFLSSYSRGIFPQFTTAFSDRDIFNSAIEAIEAVKQNNLSKVEIYSLEKLGEYSASDF